MTQNSGIPSELLSLDAQDALAHKKHEFLLPDGIVYLDGNSLGPLHRTVPERLKQVSEGEWGAQLIKSWTAGAAQGRDWMHLPDRVAAKIARLIGAQPHEVAVGDSTSINTLKVLAAALHQAGPERRIVLTDTDNFPTDLYMAQGLDRLLGGRFELRGVPNTQIEQHLTNDVACTLLTEVDYRTGRKLDMTGLTARAHRRGILTIWDLAHSAGAFPVDLNGTRADFAVGCGYKYLNGGPGAPAFLFVAQRHQEASPVFLSGWMGHADPFQMTREFSPAAGARRYVVGTPTVLSLSALDAALDAFEGVDMAVLRAKSLSLTSTFMRLMEPLTGRYPLTLATPTKPDERGSQVSYRHPQARQVMDALIARGVVGDYRTPDILRFGFTPLYHSHADVWWAVQEIATVLDGDPA